MRKKLQITFLWMAGLILFAHSVVPHIHHQNEIEHVVCDATDSDDMLDLLAKVFHNDLGVEHLEHFQINKANFNFIATVPEAMSLIEVVEYELLVSEEFPVESSLHLRDTPFLESHALRGPPLV
ncbi:hypothetical protein [Phaeocystidibacter luteus]|uniref:Uncharacterized protein n=1 Tax=Phaeocystidibacter luteus TaxID=911197 RepID=A0A6N6RF38_9FLAO|nr:hypothetical protein [Phaeocystidibacter luteus]KAB2805348.1 hypothetical protein F8C67_13950 [Phaeocystidibacter luteus]